VKYAFLRDELSGSCTTRMACRLLEVSPSGYYHFLKAQLAPRKQRRLAIEQAVVRVHAESRRIYGAPKITHELPKLGLVAHRNTVSRIMQERGIRAKGDFGQPQFGFAGSNRKAKSRGAVAGTRLRECLSSNVSNNRQDARYWRTRCMVLLQGHARDGRSTRTAAAHRDSRAGSVAAPKFTVDSSRHAAARHHCATACRGP